MKGLEVLPSGENEDIFERASWEFSTGFPLPTVELQCGPCGYRDIQLQRYQFFYKPDSPHKYRCDVSFKCRRCGAHWLHGVVIPEEVYVGHIPPPNNKRYGWREARDLILKRLNRPA